MKFSHPNSSEFKLNELKTLQYLNARKRLLKNYSGLADALSVAYFKYQSKKAGAFDFDIHVEFDMEVQKDFHKVVIGAYVTGDFDMCTYSLAVFGKDDESDEVIRKYHFDYAKPATATDQPVPTYHLQYGGELSHHYEAKKDTHLSSWLSVPRLTYSPINLALLLDLLFCEFNTLETDKVVQDRDWRNLIFNNEQFLTNQYYSSIYQHMMSQQYSLTSLIRDYCYNDR
jgi:hypothetical protein